MGKTELELEKTKLSNTLEIIKEVIKSEQIDLKNNNEDRDTLISLRRALMKIKTRERNILTDRYIVGKTQSEIATELGVSQAQVSRIEKNAINNVKRLMK